MSLKRLVQSGDVEQIEEVARELRRAREALADARARIGKLESRNIALRAQAQEFEKQAKDEHERRAYDQSQYADTIDQNKNLREALTMAREELTSRKMEIGKLLEECERERRKRQDVEARFVSLNREFLEKEEALRKDISKLRVAIGKTGPPASPKNFNRFLAGTIAEVAAESPPEISSWLKSLIEAILIHSQDSADKFKKISMDLLAERRSAILEIFPDNPKQSREVAAQTQEQATNADRRNAFLSSQVRDLQHQVEALTLQPAPRVLNVQPQSSFRVSPNPQPIFLPRSEEPSAIRSPRRSEESFANSPRRRIVAPGSRGLRITASLDNN